MVVVIVIIVLVVLVLFRLHRVYKEMIDFFAQGMDYGFRLGEVSLLWRLAKECAIGEPRILYVSIPALNRCISLIITRARHDGTENSLKTQNFLSKLYKFRTRVALDADGRKGLDDTRSLDVGQRLRIILKGRGVFFSKILSNGHDLVVSMPRSDRQISLESSVWNGSDVLVYLWRRGDAAYSFPSKVGNVGSFQGQLALFLSHSTELVRAQKRQSVRRECQIQAEMFMVAARRADSTPIDPTQAFRCLLEDISEDGAMIRVGGRGKNNVQIKLEFSIDDIPVVMYGVIRSVEFNKAMNQSRLHFECTHIPPSMRNAVLSYVYQVLPQEEREVELAIAQTESDASDAKPEAAPSAGGAEQS
ncbi:MAG: PilZ domain-containing protein [Treponema sp.]|nr:PilZ domain-containing protein [Treponema sp.]